MIGGVLGATDTVISDITSGDIEAIINETLVATRNQSQTQQDYSDLTKDIEDEIESNKQAANEQLFRTFDAEIAKKTKNYIQVIKQTAKEQKDALWNIAKYALRNYAAFSQDGGIRKFNLRKSLFKSGNYTVSPYYIDFEHDKDIDKPQRFTLHNRIAGEMLGRLGVNSASGKIEFISEDTSLKGRYGRLAMFAIDITSLDNHDMIRNYLLVGYDRQSGEIDEQSLRQIMELPSIYNRVENNKSDNSLGGEEQTKYNEQRHNEMLKNIRGESDPKLATLKAKHTATKVEEIKKSFAGTIDRGVKRIKAEIERSKVNITHEAARLDKEIAKLKRDKESGTGNSFNITQAIAETSKQLNKLKETEFLQRLQLKKDEEEKIKAFIGQFKFYEYTRLMFEVDFAIK